MQTNYMYSRCSEIDFSHIFLCYFCSANTLYKSVQLSVRFCYIMRMPKHTILLNFSMPFGMLIYLRIYVVCNDRLIALIWLTLRKT